MPHFLQRDPEFWRTSPKSLSYTRVFAEAVDHRVASFVVGEEDDVEATLAMFVNLPPGWVGVRHSHDCYRFEVVIKGSFETPEGVVLGPGDVSTSKPGEKYGPLLAGPEGVLTLEIFSRQAGLHADRESPMPAYEKIAAMVEQLRSGQISAEEAAASPAVAEWAEAAIAEQPGLRAQVGELRERRTVAAG